MNYNKNIDEEKLVDSLIAGDENAYRQVIGKFREPVIRLCMGFTGSLHDAEDLAQDIFIQVFNSIGRFRGGASLSTWIYRIAVNKSINFVRDSRRSFRDNSYPTENIESDYRPGSGVEDQLEEKEHARALHAAIDSLPENQKTAFILSKYEDIKYAQIADVMNTSLSSVESLIFRAKRNLQKKLFNYYKKNLR